MGDEPRVIIDKSNKVGFAQTLTATIEIRSMHDITLPQIIGQLGLKLSSIHIGNGLFGHNLLLVKKTIQSCLLQLCSRWQYLSHGNLFYEVRYRQGRQLFTKPDIVCIFCLDITEIY